MEEQINRIIKKLISISGLDNSFAIDRVKRIEWMTDAVIQQINEEFERKE